MLNPYLKIVERRPHSWRYKDFYDEIVRGDDASVYETYKRLIVQNIGEQPMFFKVFEKSPKQIYLVSSYPQKNPYVVQVHKQNLAQFKAKVSKKVFEGTGLVWQNEWISTYLGFK